MVLRTLPIALLCSACVHGAPPTRLPREEPVAVAYVVDQLRSRAVDDVPESVVREVEGALAPRNLVARKVPFTDVAVSYTVKRTTEHRLAQLAEFADDARVLLLVELKVTFYSHLSGRWRWDVATKLTIATKDHLDEAVSSDHGIATFLDFEHQREPQALERAAPEIAVRVARLVDDFLGGGLPAPAPAPPPPEPPEPAAPPPVPDNPAPGAPEPPVGPAPGESAPATGPSSDLGPIYFLLVDRFANGDRSNDGAIDLSDPAAFHGGDLQGVLDHLDHLQDLGIGTVWLSPIARMRTEKFFGHGAFHGYWTLDPSAVEPRFGDEALLARLSAELHRRGMRLMLDLVVNHVAPEAPLVRERPDWFHHEGPIRDFDDPAQITTHDVHGLPDLAQENPAVYAWLRRAAFRWIDRVRPDGFRLDAVKHVPLTFWARFNAEIRARAGPRFVLLGEDLDGNPAHLARTLRDGRFSHLFDFPLHFALVDVFCNDASAERIAAALTAGRAIGPDAALVTLVDNHDLPRIATACRGDLARVEGALAVLMAVRGVPALQYGTEVGLPGQREPENRGDMRFDPSHVLHAAIRRGLAMRRAHPALAGGETRFVEVRPELLVMTRATAAETAVIVVHRGARPATVAAPAGLGALRESSSGRPVGARIVVAPRSVWIGFAAGRLPPPRAVAELAVEIPPTSPNARLAPGETLLLVGADPALGAWDPARGVPFVAAPAGGLVATVRLPDDAVHEAKLVVRPATGAPRWQAGGNRQIFLRAGAGRQGIRFAD